MYFLQKIQKPKLGPASLAGNIQPWPVWCFYLTESFVSCRQRLSTVPTHFVPSAYGSGLEWRKNAPTAALPWPHRCTPSSWTTTSIAWWSSWVRTWKSAGLNWWQREKVEYLQVLSEWERFVWRERVLRNNAAVFTLLNTMHTERCKFCSCYESAVHFCACLECIGCGFGNSQFAARPHSQQA